MCVYIYIYIFIKSTMNVYFTDTSIATTEPSKAARASSGGIDIYIYISLYRDR